jgi:hypothetical protein
LDSDQRYKPDVAKGKSFPDFGLTGFLKPRKAGHLETNQILNLGVLIGTTRPEKIKQIEGKVAE